MNALKPCPQCAETVPSAARRCRHCQYSFHDQAAGMAVNRWMRAHPTIVVSLATFLYVAFQIHKSGDFEAVTTVEIIHSSTLTSILVGVLLVQLPLELLILTGVACWWLLATAALVHGVTPKPTSSEDPRTPARLTIAALLVLLFFTSPWLNLVVALLVVVAVVLVAWRRPATGTWWSRGVRGLLGVLLALLVAVLLQRPTTWVPTEKVTTTGGDTFIGYVIAADGEWTTILTPSYTNRLKPGQNSLRRVHTKEVATRSTCRLSLAEDQLFGRVVRLRSPQLIAAWSNGALPEPLTPPCP